MIFLSDESLTISIGSKVKAWGLLDRYLAEAGVPELPGGATSPPVANDRPMAERSGFNGENRAPIPETKRSREKLVLSPEGLRKGRREIAAKRGEASVAGYLRETVTSLARQDRLLPQWTSGGQGMRWGTAVHVLLGNLGKSRTGSGRPAEDGPLSDERLGLMARNALVAADLDPGRGEELAAFVRTVMRSDFWNRAMAAKKKLFEVPFSIRVDTGGPDYDALAAHIGLAPSAGGRALSAAADAPVLLSGAIDLVFWEDDGWVIADYKTDRVAEAATEAGIEAGMKAFDELVAYYRPQVSLYGRFWQKVTGQTVKESGLYFTSLGLWIRIS